MKINRHARQSAKKYFRACLHADGTLDEPAVREIVRLLATSKPRGYLGILTRIQHLVELAVEENTVRVESAVPLPDRGGSVFASLEHQFGSASRTYYAHNPALLGGLRVRRGSNIWDGSLSNRLARLQQALS